MCAMGWGKLIRQERDWERETLQRIKNRGERYMHLLLTHTHTHPFSSLKYARLSKYCLQSGSACASWQRPLGAVHPCGLH